MKRFFFTVALTVVFSSVLWAQFPMGSRYVTDSVKSEILDATVKCQVLLPAGFDKDAPATYPVLYLLHGLGGDHNTWPGRGHVNEVMDQLTASGQAAKMVVVMPQAGNMGNGWNGYFNIPGWRYEDFFFTEFLPWVEKKYRAGGVKGARAVAGFSMGGGGATVYGQHHPELFGSVYAMSALMDIPQGDIDRGQAVGDGQFAQFTRVVMDNSCPAFVERGSDDTLQSLRSVRWMVDCGDDDFLFDRNIEFVQAMHRKGVPVEFRVRDGGHTFEYWHSALYSALEWATRWFDRN